MSPIFRHTDYVIATPSSYPLWGLFSVTNIKEWAHGCPGKHTREVYWICMLNTKEFAVLIPGTTPYARAAEFASCECVCVFKHIQNLSSRVIVDTTNDSYWVPNRPSFHWKRSPNHFTYFATYLIKMQNYKHNQQKETCYLLHHSTGGTKRSRYKSSVGRRMTQSPSKEHLGQFICKAG